MMCSRRFVCGTRLSTITFTDAGVDKSVTISGLVQNPTFTGNVTVTGTISGNTVRGQTISGVTVTGTTAQFTSGTFVSLTGTTLQGTTATYTTGSFTSLTGTTTSGTTANFVSGVFSTQISGVTVTGTTANFTSGNFTNISGGTHTITSGVFAAGTAANPSISFVSDPNTGIYSPGADQVAISTGGTGRLFVDASGNVKVSTGEVFNTSATGYIRVAGGDDAGSGASILAFGQSHGSAAGRLVLTAVGSESMQFGAGGAERMRLDSSGRLGLGTSSPQTLLHLNSAAGTNTTLAYAEDNALKWYNRYNASDGSFQIVDVVNTTTRLHVSNTGNVGIGTTSPATRLNVFESTGASLFRLNGLNGYNLDIANNFDSGTRYDFNIGSGSGAFSFTTSAGERARIDSSGRLLVGTSSARSTAVYGTPSIQALGDYQQGSIHLTNNSNSNANCGIAFSKIRGSSIVQNGDYLGGLTFNGFDGSADKSGATIEAVVDGTPGANDMPGRLVFSTTADGASSPTERARITNDGYLRLAGKGIQFNGDTADANSLDDYEEGTFTPTIVGGTTAGSATYSSQNGVYRKIGSLVHFSISLAWTGGTGTGSLQISGLPFNVNTSYLPVFSVFPVNIALTAGNVIGGFSNLTAGIQLVQTPTGGGADATVTYDAAGALYVTGTYVQS